MCVLGAGRLRGAINRSKLAVRMLYLSQKRNRDLYIKEGHRAGTMYSTGKLKITKYNNN